MEILRMRSLFLISLITGVSADLRMGSWPKDSFKIRQDNNANGVQFVNDDTDVMLRYMEPSTFEYQGLSGGNGQKRKNYDQFLRSNIDNEQDNRNFNTDTGEDHLPFRTVATEILRQENAVKIEKQFTEGQSALVPLRWNNPHASEMEVNVWVFRCPGNRGATGNCKPFVVPIKKPHCSGEGYQNNVMKMTVPTGFLNAVRAKASNFDGCGCNGCVTQCVCQVYANSVESRMYSQGFPCKILATNAADAPLTGAAPTNDNGILPALKDVELDINALADPICRPGTDATLNIAANALQPRWARMISDVANHAFQNSDFSPYSGQQPSSISRNMQASAVNKMITGNRGELGKAALPQETKNQIKQLQNLENKVYKKYEALANNIINKYGRQMKDTGTPLTAGGTTQQLANVFRANSVSSTSGKRQQTNTYIPSFVLPQGLIAEAKQQLPNKYKALINDAGEVQIYVSAFNDLKESFTKAATEYGITYQPNQFKDSFATMESETEFKKRDENGKTDGGVYAGTENRMRQIEQRMIDAGLAGQCARSCVIDVGANGGTKKPLVKGSQATNIANGCKGCETLFTNTPPKAKQDPPGAISQDLIADPVADLPDTPGVDPVEDYPDEDGTERIGRPPSPSTTTKKIWYEPGPWMSGGGGGVGVVGGSTRASWDVFLLGFMAFLAIMRC